MIKSSDYLNLMEKALTKVGAFFVNHKTVRFAQEYKFSMRKQSYNQ
jgi:hypothetical protein